VEKGRESVEGQMVIDLIRVGIMIKNSRWPQMIKWNGENGRSDDKDEV
jgi:hypothetical protein